MSKETSHRGDELKGLGWSEADVARYVELWEYRQRWGAMNLEREDRLFLRKAEKALPAIVTGRAAAKKSIKDLSLIHIPSPRDAHESRMPSSA